MADLSLLQKVGAIIALAVMMATAQQQIVKGDTVEGYFNSGTLQYRFVNKISYHSFYENGNPKVEEFAISDKFRIIRHFREDGFHDYDAVLGNLKGPQFKRTYFETGGVQEEHSCFRQKIFYSSGNLKMQVEYSDTNAVYTTYRDQAPSPENPDANVKERIVKKGNSFVPKEFEGNCRNLDTVMDTSTVVKKYLLPVF